MLDELKHRHSERDLPHVSDDMPSSLACDSTSVLNALKAFPRSTSPGGSKLRAQHLLNAVAGSVAPALQTCLDQLTKFMCVTPSGRLNSLIAPWFIGAPLTALCKKNGGYRLIVVGEVLWRLASHICCAAVKSRLPDLFCHMDKLEWE